jgi:predicted transcriptional regulator
MRVDLLMRVIEDINESNYNQENYCGTRHCIAGHVASYHGIDSNISQWYRADIRSRTMPLDVHVAQTAQEELEITEAQARELFQGDWLGVWDGRFTQKHQTEAEKVRRAKARIAFFIITDGTDDYHLFKRIMETADLSSTFSEDIITILRQREDYTLQHRIYDEMIQRRVEHYQIPLSRIVNVNVRWEPPLAETQVVVDEMVTEMQDTIADAIMDLLEVPNTPRPWVECITSLDAQIEPAQPEDEAIYQGITTEVHDGELVCV